MAKFNMKKPDEKVDTQAAPAPVTQEAKKDTTPKLYNDVKAFLIGKKADGATAEQVATYLGLINGDTSKADKAEKCKKLRKTLRLVVDKEPGGDRTVREGRNKVYRVIQ